MNSPPMHPSLTTTNACKTETHPSDRFAHTESPFCILLMDEHHIASPKLTDILDYAQYQRITATTHQAAIDQLKHVPIDLILLYMPTTGTAAITFCQQLRRFTAIPLLIFVHTPTEAHTIALLDAGAHECLPASTSVLEVTARIRVFERIVARTTPPLSTTAQKPPCLTIDTERRDVCYGSQQIVLTDTEWTLLRTLWDQRTHIVSYDTLHRLLWPLDEQCPRAIVHTFVRQLRRKLGTAAQIDTIRGIGYRMRA